MTAAESWDEFMWIVFAFGSAVFAGLTAILAKCGIRKTDSDAATAIRTIVVLIFSWIMVMITGSIGMLASASLNETKFGLYEPSGGSAPDIAGQGIANPIATILSAAMMLRFSFDLDKEADAIEASVAKVLKDGYRTIDIMSEGKTQIGTARMGDEIAANI